MPGPGELYLIIIGKPTLPTMSTRKEKLAAKREEQAKKTAERKQRKLANIEAVDEKDLAADINKVEAEISRLRAESISWVKRQTVVDDALTWRETQVFTDATPTIRGHFVGKGSCELNRLYNAMYQAPLSKLRLRREILLNLHDPGRVQRIHNEKKEARDKMLWRSQRSRVIDLLEEVDRRETKRANDILFAFRTKNRDLFDELNKTPSFSPGVEVIERLGVGIMFSSEAPFARCYHSLDGNPINCDCEGNGGRDGSTTHELSLRAMRLLEAGFLVLRDAEHRVQRQMVGLPQEYLSENSMDAALEALLASKDPVQPRTVGNPFGYAKEAIQADIFSVSDSEQ